jgi:hypothetical protein
MPQTNRHITQITLCGGLGAPEAPMDPTDPWGTLGAHVVAAKGARAARVRGGVSVRTSRLSVIAGLGWLRECRRALGGVGPPRSPRPDGVRTGRRSSLRGGVCSVWKL